MAQVMESKIHDTSIPQRGLEGPTNSLVVRLLGEDMSGTEIAHFGESLQGELHIWCHGNPSSRLGFRVQCPKRNESPLHIHTVPSQIDDFTEPLPQLVRS